MTVSQQHHRALLTRGGAAAEGDLSAGAETTTSFLADKPLLAASLAAGGLCGGSDVVAQGITKVLLGAGSSWSLGRTLTSTCIGLFAFGPSCPAFYEAMKEYFPGTSLAGGTTKLVLGQLYGSVIVTLYFAAAQFQKGELTREKLVAKLKKDLPSFMLFSLVFWGIAFNLLDRKQLPILVFNWAQVLSIVANS